MKKKLLTIIIVIMMTLSIKAQDSGMCGDNLTWHWNANDSTLTIVGTGDMWDYPYFDIPHGNISTSATLLKHVIIESGVTSIGAGAFSYHIYLQDVSLPNTLISIGDKAFCTAVKLSSIEIPDSVTTIGDEAISGTDIESLTLGNSVSSIGESAFADNHCLKYVSIPNSLKTIPSAAFWRCTTLEYVDFGDSLVSIGEHAFRDCALTTVSLPETLQSIGDLAFLSTNISSVRIGSSVSNIGIYAFCSNVTIKEVFCGATTPPDCMILNNSSTFTSDTYEQGTLYVPLGCKSLYENADTWKKFTNIVESGVSVNEDFDDSISVFPNPSSDFININCKNMKSIEIISMEGKTIKNTSVDSDCIHVDISDLPSGIYLLMIKTEQTCLTREIVKK